MSFTSIISRNFGRIVGILILFRIILFVCFIGFDGQYIEEDSGYYLWLADILREHHVFSPSDKPPFSPELFRTPGYPAFLASLKELGMESPKWIVLWQELIYGLCVFIFFHCGKPLFGGKITRLGVIFLLIEPGGLSTPKVILSETLFLPFFLSGLLAVGQYSRKKNWKVLFFAGAMMGIGAWIRPAILYFPFVVAITLVAFAINDKKRWLHSGVLLFSFILMMSPWLARNYSYFGKIVMSGQQSNMLANYHVPVVWESAQGIPFWEGHKKIKEHVKQAIEEQAERLGRKLTIAEKFDLEQKIAISELKKYPWHYLKQWCFGVMKTMYGANLFEVYHAFRHRADRLHYFEIEATDFKEKVYIFLINQDYFYIAEVLLRVAVGFFALIGAFWIVIRKDCFLWIMMLANFYFICVPGPMGYARFRFPVEVFWFIQAYYGFIWIMSFLHKGASKNRHEKFKSEVEEYRNRSL